MSRLPFTLTRLDHVVLRVRDAARMSAFYVDVLGCTVERELQIGLIQLRAGSALIDIVPVTSALGQVGGSPPPTENSGRNLDHFCLRIEPFEAATLRAHFTHHGVPYRESESVYGAEGFGPSFYIEDPERNTVELKGPASKV